MPQLSQLQLTMIWETCGNIPVLIADDGSNQDAEFERVASMFSGAEFWPSDQRRGHYAGDLSVFSKGLQWAKNRNLKWLCKLSQRFIWTKRNWLSEAVRILEASGEATMMQRCLDNGVNLFVRSECVLFDVAKWIPYYKEFDVGEISNPTELFLWHRVHTYFGERFAPWPEMPENRYQPTPGSLWHGCDTEGAFRDLARSRGIELGAQFNTGGWEAQAGWKRG
jgi:hypothetical protein